MPCILVAAMNELARPTTRRGWLKTRKAARLHRLGTPNVVRRAPRCNRPVDTIHCDDSLFLCERLETLPRPAFVK